MARETVNTATLLAKKKVFEFFAIIVQSYSGEGVIPILAGIGDEECDSGSVGFCGSPFTLLMDSRRAQGTLPPEFFPSPNN